MLVICIGVPRYVAAYARQFLTGGAQRERLDALFYHRCNTSSMDCYFECRKGGIGDGPSIVIYK